MANGYQGLHVRPRSIDPRRRIAAIGVAAAIVVVAAWVAASRAGNQVNTAQSNRTSGRVFATNGTTTTVEPSPSTDATTSVPDATTGVAATASPAPAPAPAPAGQTNRTTRTATAPARTTGTTGAATVTTTRAPGPPKAVFVPPTAVWTTYSCVATGAAGWTLTYDVRFSGGSGWSAPGGGNTSTEHQSAPAGSASGAGPRLVSLSVAHVRDTINGVTRTVGLANATVVHC